MLGKITYLSKKEVRSLFLVCVFPIHLWAIIIIFRDLEYIISERNLWYAAGYAGYILAFALIESCLFFLFMFLLSYLYPQTLKQNGKAYTITCALALIFSLWAIAKQIFYLLSASPPAFFSWIMLRIPYHQTLAFIILLLVILASFVFPIVLILKSSKGQNGVNTLMERISLLSVFYLLIDVLGITAAVLRNIG
jgi:hypothetical protein